VGEAILNAKTNRQGGKLEPPLYPVNVDRPINWEGFGVQKTKGKWKRRNSKPSKN